MDTTPQPHQTRFLVLQVITKRQRPDDVKVELAELEQLVDTYGGQVVREVIQRRDKPDNEFYIGSGKVEELKQLVKDLEIEVVIVNALVKPSQLFRIEKALWEVDHLIRVWDRVDLILNIFDRHATTTESKLQIQLARISHMGPRAYGLGKTELSRQGGGVGTRGKGETNIEFERRTIKLRQQEIRQQLKKVLRQKENRMEHRRELGFGPVALVGYTSAGKTTLFNTLTGKDKEMHAKLFTTLDTVVGKMKTPDLDLPVLISDTIGFISNLPPVLFESFKSTLLESLEAKVILHVVDVSDEHWLDKVAVVRNILNSLKVEQPTIMVANKIDQLSDAERDQLVAIFENPDQFPERLMLVSAVSGEGVDELKQIISQMVQ